MDYFYKGAHEYHNLDLISILSAIARWTFFCVYIK